MSDSSGHHQQPVTVIVPEAPEQAPRTPPGGRGLRVVTIALLCVMLLVLVAVVVVLPELVAEYSAPAPALPVVPADPPAPPADTQRLAREKRAAESALGKVLRMQTELEAEGVAIWGGRDYDNALDSLAAGDAELQTERYLQATEHYERFAAELDALRESMARRLAAALAGGRAALAGEDGPEARRNFELALALDGQSEAARQGMARARVLEQVVAAVADGAALEAGGELDAALERYAAALALDAGSARALAAREALLARIRQREFIAAMSAAFAAMERREFAAARAASQRARALQPGSPEVADLAIRLERAEQASRMQAHRERAQSLERDERWSEAGQQYAAALAIDANAAFARGGKERSLHKARIHTELDVYLASLDRLSGAGPRDNARRLLAAGAGVDAKREPKLAAKLARLSAALALAETPVPVNLLSDNLTEVTVYKVGRFGRFESRELMLLPGSYVAVGQRPGYRDVRVAFTLTGGEDHPPVDVRCQEKI